MEEKQLEEIQNSYTNGQLKQMVEQIDNYGRYKFLADFLDYLRDYNWMSPEDEYTKIICRYGILKSQ